jgi:Transmembrane domain of unknown function (DUF3566)
VSKTERALTSTDRSDALDDRFDGDFDTALDREHGDADLDVADLEYDAELDDEMSSELKSDDDDTLEHEIQVVDGPGGSDDIVDGLDTPDDLDLPDVVAVVPSHAEIDTALRVPRDPANDRGDARVDTDDDVSDGILEELRRAEIDGPVVAFAPQDESAALRRKPKRAADYDPAPVPIPAKVPRVLGRRPRVRKVTRVVRHVDPWSVFKIAAIAHLVLYIIVLTASVLLWNVAYATGTVENVERFLESFGWDSFNFNGGEIYHAGWIAGLFLVIGLTGLTVLAATLFNLITDLVGGVRLTVLEEEVIETRTSPMRRFVVRRAEPVVPSLMNDRFGSMRREAVVDDTGAINRPTR